MIKFIIFDFDGVFSNSKFYFDNFNNIKKTYNAKDAYSLKILKEYNIKCGIITNDKIISIKHAPHIFDRLDRVSLGNNEPKLDIINKWMKEYDITYEEVAYIGDDLNDLEALEYVGLSASPKNAPILDYFQPDMITEKKGGEGAFRELANLIFKAHNIKLKY